MTKINPVSEVQRKVRSVIHDLRFELAAHEIDVDISVEDTADGVIVRVDQVSKPRKTLRVKMPAVDLDADSPEEAVG